MGLGRKIILSVLAVIIAIPVVVLCLVQIPAVQTLICSKALRGVSAKLDGDVSIGGVHYSPLNTLILTDVTVREAKGDTMLHVRKVLLEIDARSLRSDSLNVKRITLDRGMMHMRDLEEGGTNLSAFIAGFGSKKSAETDTTVIITSSAPESDLPWDIMGVERITLKDINFDYPQKNISVKGLEMNIDNLQYGDQLYGQLRRLDFTEGCSGDEFSMSTGILLSDNMLYLSKLKVSDGRSDIDAPQVALYFDSLKDFSDFLNKVEIDAEFNDSKFDMASVSRFVPSLEEIKVKGYLSGKVAGKVSDIRANDLRIQSESHQTDISLSARAKGLPNVDRTSIDVTLHKSSTCAGDIAGIIIGIDGNFDTSVITDNAPEDRLDLSGEVTGSLKRAHAKFRIGSHECGRLIAEANYEMLPSNVPAIKGTVTTRRLNTGLFLKNEALGNLTSDIHFNAKLSKSPEITLENLYINEFVYKDYHYSDIQASGTFENSHLNANAASQDSNLFFIANADLDFKKDAVNNYKAYLDLARADLHALNLDKRDRVILNFIADADAERSTDGIFTGEVGLSNLVGIVEKDFYNMGDILVKATGSTPEDYIITLESSLAEATYTGTPHPEELVTNVLDILKSELGNLIPIKKIKQKPDSKLCRGHLDFVTKDLRPAFAFLLPSLYVGEGSTIRMDVAGEEKVNLEVRSALVAIGENYIRDIDISSERADGPFKAAIKAGSIQAGKLALHENAIEASLKDNAIDLSLHYDNHGYDGGGGNLNAVVTFQDQTKEPYIFVADFLPSELEIKGGGKWDIAPATLSFNKDLISLDGFDITNGEQFLSLDGAISAKPTDTVFMAVNQLDIDPLFSILGNSMNLKGIFTGEAQAAGLLGKEMAVSADFSATGLEADGETLGDVDLKCLWNNELSRFDISLENFIGEDEPLLADGYYKPDGKELSMDLSFLNFNVAWADRFLTGIMQDMNGTISGDIHVFGPLDNLQISSEKMRFNGTETRVSFTNVLYICNGGFTVDTDGVHFTEVDVFDEYGNSGTARGGIYFNHFKSIEFNVLFTVKEMLGFDTDVSQAGQGFYGKAFGTGTVHLHGPITGLKMDIDIDATGGSVHIPVSGGMVAQKDLLTFVSRESVHIDPHDSLVLANAALKEKEEKEKVKGSPLALNIKLAADPSSEICIDINSASGDIIRSHGNGSVEMNIGGDNLFDIKGSFVVDDGSYTMSLLGITSKEFSVAPGGTINFNGDILQTEFNMKALYKTKASIETLIGDNTSVSTRRNVNCNIGITGAIANPQLNFKIDIPDLDPTTQGLVENALSTDEKNLKQTLALLVSGSFVPDEQSSIVNNNTILYSNASEIVSSQINNIFHQLDIPVDLGLNYQPGAATGTNDVFDVAISTQLFGNRVTINGNIGNQQYMSSSTSEFVGNVDVEVKLNKSGRLRLNLFSHAADRYSNYLDQTQRNGAGIVYQEEFDTFSGLWNKMFVKKK